MPTVAPVLRHLRVHLARHGFARRGRDFMFCTDDAVGAVIVSVQTFRPTTGVGFFVNLGTGPMAYLDWLISRHGGTWEERTAGGFALWRSRLAVPPEVPRVPDPRANWDTWQFSTDDELETMLPHLDRALDRVVPRLKELADPIAFAQMRPDREFWNTVTLREPLADLLLESPFLSLAELERRCAAAVVADSENAEFAAWLVTSARERANPSP